MPLLDTAGPIGTPGALRVRLLGGTPPRSIGCNPELHEEVGAKSSDHTWNWSTIGHSLKMADLWLPEFKSAQSAVVQRHFSPPSRRRELSYSPTRSPTRSPNCSQASDISTCSATPQCWKAHTPLSSTDASTDGWCSEEESRISVKPYELEAGGYETGHTSEPYRVTCLVAIPAYAAYGALFGLQHEVKMVFGIADNSSALSHQFSVCTSLVYVFSMVFRLLHGAVFSCLDSRSRVYIAMGGLATSMSFLALLTGGMLQPSFSVLVMAYVLGGIGFGTLESNLLSTLTFLGDETKKYATMGAPIGIFSVQVGGFFILQLGVPVCFIYAAIVAGIFCSMMTCRLFVPREVVRRASVVMPVSADSLNKRCFPCWSLPSQLRKWREWLPHIWTLPFAMTVDLLVLSAFSPGILLFVYNQPTLAALSPPLVSTVVTIPKDLFFVGYNFCYAAGGMLGRCYAYMLKRSIHPFWFTLLSTAGAVINVLGMPGHCLGAAGPMLAPVAAIAMSIGDGLIYNTISRGIDARVPKAYNLAAVSFWLFLGDTGAIVGSNSIPYLRDWIVS